MLLSQKTKIDDLFKKYPFLLDFLVDLSPKFQKLKNPIMRRTIGKMANLSQVASFGDMSAENLMQEIQVEIKRVTDEDVELEFGVPKEKKFINKEARLEVLKDIIRDLHQGGNIEQLKKRFTEFIKDVSPAEISEIEQKLIEEGMPEEEIKRLCDVHVQVFKESLENQKLPEFQPGHPIQTLTAENRALEEILSEMEGLLKKIGIPPNGFKFKELRKEVHFVLEKLTQIEKHYLKKENQLFPLLEAKGVSGPTKVMWAIHDDVRAHLKAFEKYLDKDSEAEALSMGQKVMAEIKDMIYKEEKILFPMSLETLDERDWAQVKRGEEEIGYAWIVPGEEWKPHIKLEEVSKMPDYKKPLQKLDLATGAMAPEQVNLALTHLPLDLTFVDENDTVAYYSQTKERIFPRSPGVIGRKVQSCHPPASVHKVNQILDAFKAGKRDVAEFWIQMSGRFLHIRYFAIRDEKGKYRGCLEVSQDLTPLRALEGEKRLLDWE